MGIGTTEAVRPNGNGRSPITHTTAVSLGLLLAMAGVIFVTGRYAARVDQLENRLTEVVAIRADLRAEWQTYVNQNNQTIYVTLRDITARLDRIERKLP